MKFKLHTIRYHPVYCGEIVFVIKHPRTYIREQNSISYRYICINICVYDYTCRTLQVLKSYSQIFDLFCQFRVVSLEFICCLGKSLCS